LVHLDDLATLVVAAFRADTVLHARLLAIWTGDGLWYPQRIVRSALAAT
jgi:hypothetical protein